MRDQNVKEYLHEIVLSVLLSHLVSKIKYTGDIVRGQVGQVVYLKGKTGDWSQQIARNAILTKCIAEDFSINSFCS